MPQIVVAFRDGRRSAARDGRVPGRVEEEMLDKTAAPRLTAAAGRPALRRRPGARL